MRGGRFGDASNWYANALAIGIPTTTTPTSGAVLQSTNIGHVAYTESPGAPSTVEDYNWNFAGTYHEHTWSPSDAEYLIFGTLPTPPTQVAITTPQLVGTISPSGIANLGPAIIQLQDASGKLAKAGTGGVTVNLGSTSAGGAFATSSGGTPIQSVTIAAGLTETSIYYGDSTVGTPTITASASGLTPAIQVESVGPIVSSIQPQQGPTGGNTLVTISGSGFNSGSAVVFGAKPAISTTYVSSTQLNATSPPALAGVADVMVISNGAESIASAVDRFVYGNVSNYRGLSTQQYSLSGSNGSSWSTIDTSRLTLTVVPSANSYAVLNASASLFTNTAGVNQDLGITVSPNPTGCTQSPVVWKESGGAISFRPNPVSMEIACTFQQGTTYTVQLVWKSNVNTSGIIYAGAGAGPYSPTVISASLYVDNHSVAERCRRRVCQSGWAQR
jgi:hypothetical protein